jgi:DNA-binding PucR family transcriptional regulator
MTLAERLHPDNNMVQTRDLLIYRVLGRDRVALADLVQSVLTPLNQARGGAGPLIDNLEAYFNSGEVATATARRLHVSVRTVTYRLAKIADLTGYDPTIPAQRLTLQASVVGARMLPWPETQLATSH